MTDLDRLIRSIRITAGYDDPVLMSAKQVFALTSEVLRLREHQELCTANLLKGYETGKAEDRAAVAAWLREWQSTMDDRITHDDLDYAIAVIERGKHRREEER